MPDSLSVEMGLAHRLVTRGRLDETALERAVRVRQASGERMPSVLVKLGLAAERDVAEALAEELGLRLANPGDYPSAPPTEALASRFLRQHRLVPVADAPDALIVAMADPLDGYAVRAVELACGRRVEGIVGVPADIEQAIERLYGDADSPAGTAAGSGEEAAGENTSDDVERLKDMAGEAPVIRLVNHYVAAAVEARASDIHVEPFDNRLRVRFRIDGVLREMEPPPMGLQAAILSRIKIMAKLNIAERRLPQDGRFRIAVRGKEIDLRVSAVPTMHGESAVLRILDRRQVPLDFAALGFGGDNLSRFLEALDKPDSIILVTGPTGSGKTTTLYASLLRLNTPERKILTVEDPIEYHLEGVNQIQVKPGIGLDFARVLRAILRQDPDAIMIGEIRDLETAQIAVQAALTGHTVLSTLHTNNAAASVTRLLDMGVEDYLITSTLTAVVAQRLVRTLCPHCRLPVGAVPDWLSRAGLLALVPPDGPALHRAVGCPRCAGTGFLGRTTIAEVLPLTDRLRRLVLGHAEAGEVARAAAAEGMRTMYEDGIGKALAGITTVEEVLRVCREV